MDGIYDLVEILKEKDYHKADLLEALQTISRISQDKWKSVIDEIAEEENLCPECFDTLIKRDYVDWYPFGDTQVAQEHIIMCCPFHGEI